MTTKKKDGEFLFKNIKSLSRIIKNIIETSLWNK